MTPLTQVKSGGYGASSDQHSNTPSHTESIGGSSDNASTISAGASTGFTLDHPIKDSENFTKPKEVPRETLKATPPSPPASISAIAHEVDEMAPKSDVLEVTENAAAVSQSEAISQQEKIATGKEAGKE